jgi:hypothetical protein
MKNHYFVVVAGFLLVVSNALGQGQPPSPETPEATAVRGRKSTAPFLGITVNIPLWKVFGKKKAKALPEMPQQDAAPFYADDRLQVVPEPMSSEMGEDSAVVVIMPTTGHEAMQEGDATPPSIWNQQCGCWVLPVDAIGTAPRLPGGSGGGSPGSGGGSGGDVGGTTGNPPSGNPPPLTEAQNAECAKCKRDARRFLADEEAKMAQAQHLYDLQSNLTESKLLKADVTCGVESLGVGLLIFSAGKWFGWTGWGLVAVGAATVIGGVVYNLVCLQEANDTADLERFQNNANLSNAKQALAIATTQYQQRVNACGVCP